LSLRSIKNCSLNQTFLTTECPQIQFSRWAGLMFSHSKHFILWLTVEFE